MRTRFTYTHLFSSFFGAVMVAGAFAYYNYKFSEYKFFDFKQHIFYTKKDIFVPDAKAYTVLIYSSNMQDVKKLSTQLTKDNPILAIDLYQKRFKEEDSIISISTGMNTLLKLIQRFNIYDVPCAFEIVQIKNELYKQDTMIEKLQ
ncbi:MAG TPA: hypothetical protein EYG95_03485 [Campylobacterales bacterium]|nr:hypothetical protein [Campylobacterales bacterium]